MPTRRRSPATGGPRASSRLAAGWLAAGWLAAGWLAPPVHDGMAHRPARKHDTDRHDRNGCADVDNESTNETSAHLLLFVLLSCCCCLLLLACCCCLLLLAAACCCCLLRRRRCSCSETRCCEAVRPLCAALASELQLNGHPLPTRMRPARYLRTEPNNENPLRHPRASLRGNIYLSQTPFRCSRKMHNEVSHITFSPKIHEMHQTAVKRGPFREWILISLTPFWHTKNSRRNHFSPQISGVEEA